LEKIDKIKLVYFLGIGGIGMSALARYFNHIGKLVFGYDKTKTELTTVLEKENITIYFDENTDRLNALSDSQNQSGIKLFNQ
jgi:UDP-N-acetylmuramate--alanine ligase